MIRKFLNLGLLWPSVFLVVVGSGLVSLGSWQLQRKSEKDAIVADIKARVSLEPADLTKTGELERWLLETEGGTDGEYTPVRLSGVFDHDKERFYFAPDQKLGPGFHIYTPLRISDERVVWINRGFVPQQLREPKLRFQGQITGGREVVGLVRLPGVKGLFSAKNDVSGNNWYWRDLKGMHESAFGGTKMQTYPIFVEALADEENPVGWPRGGVTRVEIPNRHFGYALTWFGLALTLLGVYVAFVWDRLRARSRQKVEQQQGSDRS